MTLTHPAADLRPVPTRGGRRLALGLGLALAALAAPLLAEAQTVIGRTRTRTPVTVDLSVLEPGSRAPTPLGGPRLTELGDASAALPPPPPEPPGVAGARRPFTIESVPADPDSLPPAELAAPFPARDPRPGDLLRRMAGDETAPTSLAPTRPANEDMSAPPLPASNPVTVRRTLSGAPLLSGAVAERGGSPSAASPATPTGLVPLPAGDVAAVESLPPLPPRPRLRVESSPPVYELPPGLAPATLPEPTDGEHFSLTFGPGTSFLTEPSVTQLLTLASDFRVLPDSQVAIRAYASDAGRGSTARRLSLERGLAVRAFLVENGVPEDQIEIIARGSATNAQPVDRVDVALVSDRP